MMLSEWYERLVSSNGTLTGVARLQRDLLLKLGTLGFVCSAFLVIKFAVDGLVMPALIFTLGCISPLCVLRHLTTHPHPSPWVMQAYLAVSTVVTLSLDLWMRQVGYEGWAFMVLLVDLALVLRLGPRVARGLLAVAILWQVLMWLEATNRFGLWDVTGRSRSDIMSELTMKIDCADPPCAQSYSSAARTMLMGIVVFLGDYLATRGFSDEVLDEQSAMKTTISIVQDIATRLSEYDVDTVSQILRDSRGKLPAEMHQALMCLDNNLRAYQPYLPAGLFIQKSMPRENAVLQSAPIPGAMSNVATIVFTDIRASTSIWEAVPEAMATAIWAHNDQIRAAIAAYGGYEVKTIGDSFMVAFDDCTQGVLFSLEVHERLLRVEWPADLLQVPVCAPSSYRDVQLWGGLTVRIGANHGPVTIEMNELTGRADYFGNTVNVASRLEGACLPGAVAIPVAMWESISSGSSGFAGLVTVAPAQEAELKGLNGTVPIHCMWPVSLSGRQSHPLPFVAKGEGSPTTQRPTHRSFTMRDNTLDKMVQATVGVVKLYLKPDNTTVNAFNAHLEVLSHVLERNSGSIVSILGPSLSLGWNLMRKSQAHAESALLFVHHLRKSNVGPCLDGVGLASGAVYHGDVGSRRQRFLTIMGPPVQVCMSLVTMSCAEEKDCLYAPCVTLTRSRDDFTLPAAVRPYLQGTPTERIISGLEVVVYECSDEDEESASSSLDVSALTNRKPIGRTSITVFQHISSVPRCSSTYSDLTFTGE